MVRLGVEHSSQLQRLHCQGRRIHAQLALCTGTTIAIKYIANKRRVHCRRALKHRINRHDSSVIRSLQRKGEKAQRTRSENLNFLGLCELCILATLRWKLVLHPLKNPGSALAHAHAHRHHAVLQLVALKGVNHGGGTNRTGGSQRMAQRNRAAHGVDLGRV